MKTIHAISAHAEGEVDDVIVGGVAPPPGDTIRQQRSFIARDETLLVRQSTQTLTPPVSSWSPKTRRQCPAPIRSVWRA